jgi:hypothetical protein
MEIGRSAVDSEQILPGAYWVKAVDSYFQPDVLTCMCVCQFSTTVVRIGEIELDRLIGYRRD